MNWETVLEELSSTVRSEKLFEVVWNKVLPCIVRWEKLSKVV